MGTITKLECRHCGASRSVRELRERHGPGKPRCVGQRSIATMQREDLVAAGQLGPLFDLTDGGLVRRLPLYVWWREPVYSEPDPETAEVKVERYELVEMVTYDAVVPRWAKELARKLSSDRKLARQLGFTQKRRLATRRGLPEKSSGYPKSKRPDAPLVKVWEDCDLDRTLPIALRAKIMTVAATNALARELIMDDPEAAGRIIKDAL